MKHDEPAALLGNLSVRRPVKEVPALPREAETSVVVNQWHPPALNQKILSNGIALNGM